MSNQGRFQAEVHVASIWDAVFLFPSSMSKDPVAKEVFQFLCVYFRNEVKPPGKMKALGDETLQQPQFCVCF